MPNNSNLAFLEVVWQRRFESSSLTHFWHFCLNWQLIFEFGSDRKHGGWQLLRAQLGALLAKRKEYLIMLMHDWPLFL